MRIHYENKIDVTEQIRIILETAPTPFRQTVTFDNGLKATIIRYPGTYGYQDDLFELAIWKDNHAVGDDVHGWLDVLDVLIALAEINEGKTEITA